MCARRFPTTRSSASAAQTHGYTDLSYAPVAQGIERCPAEAEAASSNLAGRMAQCQDLAVGSGAGAGPASVLRSALRCVARHVERELEAGAVYRLKVRASRVWPARSWSGPAPAG